MLLCCIVQITSPCPFCPVAPTNTVGKSWQHSESLFLQANIAILNARIETMNANHIREMEERRAEERCANQLLQDQIKEIQVLSMKMKGIKIRQAHTNSHVDQSIMNCLGEAEHAYQRVCLHRRISRLRKGSLR